MNTPRHSASATLLLLLALTLLSSACNDADDTSKACAESNLIDQCPAGSNPILDANATDMCSGMADGDLITESGSVTGSCASSGACTVLCQFAVPCDCGVKSVTRDAIECNPCETTSCTPDAERCDANTRQICNQAGNRWESFACNDGTTCLDEAGVTSCYDPDFTECDPGASRCNGAAAETCNDAGNQWTSEGCGTGRTCAMIHGTATCAACTPGETFGCQPDRQSFGYCTDAGETELMQCGNGAFFAETCYDTHAAGAGCHECAVGDRECGDDDNLYVFNNAGTFEQTVCNNGCVLGGPSGDRPECQ